ncbi:MAG: hypothetical protein KME01_02285 [Chroococcus sp. CMT-3BRIN-NPC107]|jgi:hypothetical protein|nr:hypothetical protein [Chroococcus sp. CMT-3BRIN-NPC107]
MLSTTELRWFYPGKLPEAISAWFNAQYLGKALESPEKREDIYLYVASDCDYMGIKLRQGRLEIKWRKAELGILRVIEGVEGKLETWNKWTCEDSTAKNFQPQSVIDKSHWVRVSKVRQQRKYQVLSKNLVQDVPLNTIFDNGCDVELTQLNISGNDWWSIALEAFGESTDNLPVVANRVFQRYNALALAAKNSFAYPSWLTTAI